MLQPHRRLQRSLENCFCVGAHLDFFLIFFIQQEDITKKRDSDDFGLLLTEEAQNMQAAEVAERGGGVVSIYFFVDVKFELNTSRIYFIFTMLRLPHQQMLPQDEQDMSSSKVLNVTLYFISCLFHSHHQKMLH